ncbi:FecR family protein [Pedobacter deserti]|uniref:FecR family protein n=1 Tax=Pedobacter deserti TaxID=2817382 RepID=UPI00210E23C4|nr:FecR family protein [Pedobacter sp. SYSU D00382]
MDANQFNSLYQRYLNKDMSPEQLEEFRQVVLDTEQEEMLSDRMERHWNELAEDDLRFPEGERADAVFEYIVAYPVHEKTQVRLWPRIAVAAAAVAIITLGISLFKTRPFVKTDYDLENQVHVGPGKNSATLTLANGKTIRLSDAANGELAREAGVLISKSPSGQLIYEIKDNAGQGGINKLSTARGETYQVRLPDGSDVWLNSASSLSYAADLISQGKRMVRLEGEAYFSVSKDREHPFIVECRGQQIQVLGTQFNVNAYTDEPVLATTLLEGSVNITAGSGKVKIVPGEQAALSAGKLSVRRVEVENVVDWKNGDFALNHIAFKTAMRKIARWYDMEIVYDEAVPDNLESGGWISRKKPLSAVLKSIESSGLVKFKVSGRTIFVTQ